METRTAVSTSRLLSWAKELAACGCCSSGRIAEQLTELAAELEQPDAPLSVQDVDRALRRAVPAQIVRPLLTPETFAPTSVTCEGCSGKGTRFYVGEALARTCEACQGSGATSCA